MLKIVFSAVSIIVGIYCFIPYVRDIRKGTTKPHTYSWLVWSLLQGTAAVIILQNGGGLGFLTPLIGFVLCGYIVMLSLKHGTKNIDLFDTICLIGSLFAIGVWFFLNESLISVILISIIDFVGFIPTLRKAYREPETETAITYVLAFVSYLFAIGAMAQYSIITTLYLISLLFTNGACALIIVIKNRRRKMI